MGNREDKKMLIRLIPAAVILITASCIPETGTLPLHFRNDEGVYLQLLDARRLESGKAIVKLRVVNDAPIPQQANLTCTFKSGGREWVSYYGGKLNRYQWRYEYVIGPKTRFRAKVNCRVERE